MEKAILAAFARTGGAPIDRQALIKQFLDRGASRPTVYRWYSEIMASGKPGQRAVEVVKRASERRAKRVADPALDAARAAAGVLPVAVSLADVTGLRGRSVIDQLQDCLKAAQDVMKASRAQDGGVRNSKMLLVASEHLRRSLETSVKLYEAMQSVSQIDKLHEAIIAEISQVDPALAERVFRRLAVLSSQWAV